MATARKNIRWDDVIENGQGRPLPEVTSELRLKCYSYFECWGKRDPQRGGSQGSSQRPMMLVSLVHS